VESFFFIYFFDSSFHRPFFPLRVPFAPGSSLPIYLRFGVSSLRGGRAPRIVPSALSYCLLTLPLPANAIPPFPQPTHTAHAWLLSWFLGAFCMHHMELAGKAAGKDVGMWFEPSGCWGC
jgi:hypothetical protein